MLTHNSTQTNENLSNGQTANNQSPATKDSNAVEWAGVLIAAAVGLAGVLQYINTDRQQKIDSKDKERQTKEEVVTGYGKAVSDIFLNKDYSDNRKSITEEQANFVRGLTLIALRRIDRDENDTDDKSNDNGKLKGLIVRYLYDAKAIGFYTSKKPSVLLWGANLNKVLLKDSWLPYIALSSAELNDADFTATNLNNANLVRAKLRNANFTQADLTEANLIKADLRNANLTTAKLDRAQLDGACYVKEEGKKGTHFPPGFDPELSKMVAIDRENSNPENKDKFHTCAVL